MKAHILTGTATGALAIGAFALGSLVSPSEASAQNSPERGELFKGCEDEVQPPTSGTAPANPRNRIENARGANSGGTGRIFASVGTEQQTGAPINDAVDECWSRIDGLWVELGMWPSFDQDFRAGGWGAGADTTNLHNLTHSVYEQPRYLVIDKTNSLQRELIATLPFGGGSKIAFSSSDGIGLTEAFSQRGPVKRYRASQNMRSLGRDLTVRVTSSGVAVLTIGDTQFIRPRPELSPAQRANQTPMQDAFNRADNIKDLDVVSQGFDVTKQNPNRFGENNKRFVFERKTSTDYYTKSGKIIPIDLAFDVHGDQGSIYFTSITSTASEIQSAYASSFGVSVKAGISGSASNKKQTRSVNLEASVGYGSRHSNSEFSSLEQSNSVSQAIGYSRFRKFALVRDHAQSELDGFFRDAIITAVSSGDFSQIIKDYGTHYPYATTFGSSGQVRHTTTDEGYREIVGQNASGSKNVSANFLIGEANVSSSDSRQSSSSFERRTQFGRAFFDAVGGNGSWNEGGFSEGATPYPILMDMRPLDELLNPMNFPGQPTIYDQGRRQLAATIDDYLRQAGRRVGDRSLLPEIIPEQRWTMRALSLDCYASGTFEGQAPVIQLQGSMRLDLKYGRESSRVVFNVTSKKGYRRIFCDGTQHKATDLTAYVIEGTAQEIEQAVWRVRTNFDEVDFGSPIRELRKYAQGGAAQALWPDKIFQGKSDWEPIPDETELNSSGKIVRTYRVPRGPGKFGQPDLRLRVEFEREK